MLQFGSKSRTKKGFILRNGDVDLAVHANLHIEQRHHGHKNQGQKARDFFDETSPQTFATGGLINSYRFRKDVVLIVKQGQLAFSESYQQLANSADWILFLQIFCGLNFSSV